MFNMFFPIQMIFYRIAFGHFLLNGFSSAIKKEIYVKSGEFNKDLNAQEDSELGFRVAKLGKIEFLMDLPVTFSGRRFKKGFFHGLSQYISTYIALFVFKKKVVLTDVR